MGKHQYGGARAHVAMLVITIVACSISIMLMLDKEGMIMTQSTTQLPVGDRTRLLINVGPGTTATHTLHRATCLLGLPGVHWMDRCIRVLTENGVHNKRLEDSVRAHSRGVQFFWHKILQMTAGISVKEVLTILEQAMRGAINFGKILAFHDSPYPSYMGLFERIHQERYGAPPIIIMSHRDPVKWVISRYAHQHGLICLDNYDHIDHFGCMERALLAHQTSKDNESQGPLLLKDVFIKHGPINVETLINDSQTTILKAADGSKHKLSDIMDGSARGAEAYYQRFSNRSVITVDLFESATKVDEHEIAEQLRQVLPRFLLEKGYNASLMVDNIPDDP